MSTLSNLSTCQLKSFLALVRAGLWEKDVLLSQYGELDFDSVYQLAEEQSLVGLVTAGLEQVRDAKVSQDWTLQLIGVTLVIEQQNKAMNEFIALLTEKLGRAGIRPLLVKGQGIAQCYERPFWRSSGDVDLFLSDDDYRKAKELLLPLGKITEPEEKAKKHFAMSIDGWAVELHGSLFSGLSSRVDKVLDGIQKEIFHAGKIRSWMNGNTQMFLPHPDEDAVYVFTHILQHFYKGGIGLRQICDWCRLLWTYRAKLDLRLLETRVKEMGLLSEWKGFGAFTVNHLGMPAEAMPLYSSDEKWRRKAERICSFVMEVGNFGHNRDMSYYGNYPYVVRKAISAWWRVKDLCRHAALFPLDSLRFFPGIMFNGVRSALRGE